MKRYAVEDKHLKSYTTTEKDLKKGNIRIPSNEYLIIELPSLAKMTNGSAEGNEIERSESKSIYIHNEEDKEVKLEDFNIIKKIGKGGFGVVYLAEKIKDGTIYALKQLRKDMIIKRDAVINAKLEKEILKLAKHQFLVGMKYVIQSPVNIFFIMKFYRGGELYRHLKAKRRFDEEATKFYVAQIVLALGELHKQNIVYRDMKPENILLDVDGYVALADFGLSKILSKDENTKTFCGTPDYIAPEIIRNEEYNKQVDWWGVGILIYELMSGRAPFSHRNQLIMHKSIKTCDVPFPEPINSTFSNDAKDIIKALLCKDPANRLGAKGDAEEVLAHPFFSKIDIPKLLNKELKPPFKPPVNEKDKYDLQNFASMPGPIINIDVVDPQSMETIEKNKVIITLTHRQSLIALYNLSSCPISYVPLFNALSIVCFNIIL